MKKKKLPISVLAALTAVLLMMGLLGACEFSSTPEAETGDEPETSRDGWVTLYIKTSDNGGRALTTAAAKAAVNFYEVIFQTGSGSSAVYTRTAWYKGSTGRLAVPPANYDGASNRAVLLAGANNAGAAGSFTLLAVGFLTDVIDGTAPHGGTAGTPYTTIGNDTTSVNFTLFALTGAPSTSPAASSFKITAPVGSKTEALGTIPTVAIETTSYTVPYFAVPAGESGILAQYTIAPLDSQKIDGSGGSTTLGSLLSADAGTLTPVGVVSSWEAPVGLGSAGIQSFTNGVITMELETEAAPGLCALFFDQPVKGLALDVPGGSTWHLRGGMINYKLDSIQGTGNKTDTIAGGILLAVGIGTAGPVIVITGNGP